MKKILITLTLVLLTPLLLVYTLVFTSFGNKLLSPYIQDEINKHSPVSVKLSQFHLDLSTLKVLLRIDEKNTILAQGNYSLFSQDFDIDYEVKLTDLASFSKLANRKLSGKLITQGNVKGDISAFKIKGNSDIAKSTSEYAIVVHELKVHKAAIKLDNADIQNFLSLVGEKPYAKGKIDLHAQLNDLNPNDLKGSVVLSVKDARFNKKILKDELGLTIHKTSLQGSFNAKLQGNTINYQTKITSELANINSKGRIKTDTMLINSKYTLDIKELALFKSITNAPLRGPFFTQGKITGENKTYNISGDSDLAASSTQYSLKLKDNSPQELRLNIKDASLEKMLYLLGEAPYAKALINVEVSLDNLDPKAPDGKASMRLSKGQINQKVMKKHFDVELPKTDFSLKTDVKIKPDNINYTFLLASNLAKIGSQGDIEPQDLNTKASYDVNIKELSLLKPLTKAPFRGAFTTKGNIKGNRENLFVKGDSDLAQSSTNYQLQLTDLEAKNAKLSIKNAEISKLLYLVGEANYAKGKLTADVNLDDIAKLSGTTQLSIKKGLLHHNQIKKDFDIQLPYTKFELLSDATIVENKLTAKTTLTSNLATLKAKKTRLDISTMALKSDYEVFIPFLERLEPILERKLYGEVKARGEVSKDKKLSITAHSNIFNGKINAKIVDEKINADFTNLRTIKFLKTLGYPEVLDAPINGSFNYNTLSQKGKLDARFEQATLTRSKMTDILKNFTHTDLTKERFNQGSLVSNINKEIINSKLSMKSKTMKLESKKFIVDSKKQTIDARFALQIKKYPGDVLVKGAITSPSVKLDAKSMITPEIEKKVGKEINRFLKKLF